MNRLLAEFGLVFAQSPAALEAVLSDVLEDASREMNTLARLGRAASASAQFGARIGLVPRQHSSGGKNNLGGFTKRGDNYLRSLLIQGAKSAVMMAHKRSDPISLWVTRPARASGLAESRRGPGQQERAHPIAASTSAPSSCGSCAPAPS